LRVLWAFLVTVLWTILFGLSGIFLTIFESNKGRVLGHCARLWGKFILFSCAIRYKVKGLENLDPNVNYIFAGNHTSVLDIPLAFSGLPYWLVPIAKMELKKVIVLGWVMSTAGHIFINRKKSETALRVLEKAKNSLIDKPRSILLFPEGTRTRDGSLGPFKRGGLLLSLDTEMPIVPIAFIGAYDMLGKGSWSMKGHRVELRVGRPIDPGDYSYDNRRELAEFVREKVKELI
jgi:1-acyl-sn-glycerol-3-phosphate acyltransferase